MRILIFSVSCKEIDDNEYCRCTIRRTYLRYQRFMVGVFKQAVKTPQIDAVFGSLNGIEGIINDQLIDLKLVIKQTRIWSF